MSVRAIELEPSVGFGPRPFVWLGMVFGFVVAAIAIVAGQPLAGVAAAAAFPTAAFLWSRPQLVAPVVIFALYTNANAVAVNVHGLPFLVGAAVPLLLLVPIWRHLRESGDIVLTPVVPLLIAYILVQFLGAVLSIQPDVAITEVVTTLTEGLALYVLVTNAIRGRAALERVMRALVVAGVLMGSLTVYQHFTGSYASFFGTAQVDSGHKVQNLTQEELQERSRPSGPVDAPNRYAQILAVLLPLSLAMFAMRRSPRAGMLALASFAIIGVATALTLSRGVTAGIALTFVGAAALGYVRVRIVFGCIAMMAIVFLSVPRYAARVSSLANVATFVSEGPDPTGADVDGSVQSRATEMLAAALMFSEHPIIGVGPGMYAMHYQAYARRVGGRIKLGQDRRSHSMYLDVAAEHGLVGFVLFFSMIGVTLRDLIRARAAWLEENPAAAYLATGFLLALGIYLTTAITLHVAFARYLWMIMALAAVASRIEPVPSRTARA